MNGETTGLPPSPRERASIRIAWGIPYIRTTNLSGVNVARHRYYACLNPNTGQCVSRLSFFLANSTSMLIGLNNLALILLSGINYFGEWLCRKKIFTRECFMLAVYESCMWIFFHLITEYSWDDFQRIFKHYKRLWEIIRNN